MKSLNILLLLGLPLCAAAQNPAFLPRHDNVWLFGYGENANPQDTAFGTSVMDFNKWPDPPEIYFDSDKKIDFDLTSVTMSDSFGNYLFAFNGLLIEGPNGKIMENGGSLESGIYSELLIQGGIVLPIPGHPDKYALIHTSLNFLGSWGAAVNMVLYTTIDMNRNNGVGEVTSQKSLILSDTLDFGKVVGTRHANGRDWWIILPKYDSNTYFKFILDPNGVSYVGIEDSGMKHRAGSGQAAFSPDGNFYAKYSIVNQTLGTYFDLYSFDRCTGEINHLHQIHFWEYGIPGGVCFSPNSKYLYCSYLDHIYQIDLSTGLYEQDIVATYDGYISELGGGFLVPTYFGLLQPGPDGKIYCTPTYATVRELHSIDRPNAPGLECRVSQHSIKLPTLQRALPNFPNYRLGPIDNSPCDTLNLDNLPAAHFRWEFWDTLTPLNVSFINLSIYEPTEWHWDFGDGTGSSEKDPEHLYTVPGAYPVCLRVRNANGADSICYQVQVGTSTETEHAPAGLEVAVVPNPFQSVLAFSVPGLVPWQRIDVHLWDRTGREVARTAWRGPHADWQLGHLPAGLYFYELISDDGRRALGKALKK